MIFFFPDFKEYYYSAACKGNVSTERLNTTATTLSLPCSRESSILFLLLMLGTLWLSVSIYNFNKTLVQTASIIILKVLISYGVSWTHRPILYTILVLLFTVETSEWIMYILFFVNISAPTCKPVSEKLWPTILFLWLSLLSASLDLTSSVM